MKTVDFNNDNVKEKYQIIIKEHRGLAKIISNLLEDYKQIIIYDIVNCEYGIQMIIDRNKETIYLEVDFLKKKIYLKKPNKEYKEIYDNLPMMSLKPIGYLYENNKRTITKKKLFDLVPNYEKTYHYELNEDGNHYALIISNKNSIYDEKEVVELLLYRQNRYNNIRDLFVAINETLNINQFDIKIADSKGSIISIKDGKIDKYIEYQDNQTIYLENDEFYVTKKVIEKYEDNLTSYVKKIGENNGEEER